MDLITDSVSSFSSPALSSNLLNLNYKQFRRTYPGNYSINFALALSGCNDFAVKQYTDFFLTNKIKISDIFKVEDDRLISNVVSTYIKSGDNYLKFKFFNENYGYPIFGTDPSDSSFYIKFFDDNRCQIYQIRKNINFYLVCDDHNDLYFVRQKFLTFDDQSINPQDFIYMFSESGLQLYIFKATPSGCLFIKNEQSKAITIPIVTDEISLYINNPLTINKNIYFDPSQTIDTSFITYDDKNKVDYNKSIFNLKNNFLINKHFSDKRDKSDIIILKNQLTQNDVFTSGNNLLSSLQSKLYVDGLREYTSIFKDINQESENELELNYVFYNKTYKIIPGSNIFTSPSSMFPFEKLNINDSKFVFSGAYSNVAPLYADKVYHLSNKKQNYDNGQYLLCTWLSGSNLSNNKVWVDRYYYPDLIDKESALAMKPYAAPTYDEYLEKLIKSNSQLGDSVETIKFFDKKSELAFEPNQVYNYERITATDLIKSTSSDINYCNVVTSTSEISIEKNYFEDINSSGVFTFAVYLKGTVDNWTIFSERNAIDAGFKISKNGTDISFNFDLYDSSSGIYTHFSETSKIIGTTDNIFVVSIDTINGIGYMFYNYRVILQFTFDKYQYTSKRILFGNIFIKNSGGTYSIVDYITNSDDLIISTEYTKPDLIFGLPMMNKNFKIDDIYITLPCGMRNGSDNIELLNSVCESLTFKSNNINVYLKNIHINNENILNGIRDSITTTIGEYIPTNSKINNITFQNFK